jgi:diguanylate cyclase (GGDEF)-like protein
MHVQTITVSNRGTVLVFRSELARTDRWTGMTSDGRQVERLRANPMLVTMLVVQLLAVGLFLLNLTEQRIHPIWGWIPAIVGTSAAALACRQAAATPGLTPVVRRLWRQFALVVALVVLGLVGDSLRTFTVSDQAALQQHDPVTTGIYVIAMVTLLWALLRLPIGKWAEMQRVVRFILDALTLTITTGIFAWYVTVRTSDEPSAAGSMITIGALGLIIALAMGKVAMSGLGGMDPIAIRLLALGATVGAVGGAAFPVLVRVETGLSGTQLFVPATMIFVAFAADRQRRAPRVPQSARLRRVSGAMPYIAVAATDGLLLLVGYRAGADVFTVAAAAAFLTALVAVRQITAQSENVRLLRRVDAGQQQLAHRANHDDLTDLANRALFEQRTQESLARMSGDTLSVAVIDLDDFKAINDRLGHTVGDALLVVVGERLRECVRQDDVVARLGGDEFGLLLHGLRTDQATDVLDRITDALNRPVDALGHDLLVRVSVGLAQAWPEADPVELLRRADLAMYAAKERGKGRHAVYDAELERHLADDARLGAELRQALDKGEFSLVYQPIVALPDGRWTGLETLVRWHSPVRGAVGPDVFVPIAERTGLIVPLGDWILRTALRQAAEWDLAYGLDAPREIGINVSARQLREPGFAGDVRDALADTGFDPARVVVEVTETAVFDGGMAVDTLQELVGLGVKVALDDFGTGHSSLGLLRSCPVDVLKVDKSFVDGIGGRSEEAVIATALIQITNGLHLLAIAEGVETADQADTLYRLGYRFAQGYFFSRPLSAAQVRERLEAVRVPV